ncbi:MAG: hypothetical protein IJD18_01100 [Clostridia bacterium]|nr:hypothetical protein [Clostridia bacterium]
MHARVAVVKVGNVTTYQYVENIVSFAIFPPRGRFFAVLREGFVLTDEISAHVVMAFARAPRLCCWKKYNIGFFVNF